MSNIKKSLLKLCCIFISTALTAQNISVNLILAKPSPYVSEWNKPVTGKLILFYTPTGTDHSPVEIIIYSELKNDQGHTIASTNMQQSTGYYLKTGVNVFGIDQVFQPDNLLPNSLIYTMIAQSGKLASGNYQLGVKIFKKTIDNLLPLTEMKYRNFMITSYQLPSLISPGQKSSIDAAIAQSVITFRWTPLIPLPAELPDYTIQIYEINDGQEPMQALKINAPILIKTIKGLTQYIWQPQMYLKDNETHHFIWTIETTDQKGNNYTATISNNFGISEPAVFSIKPTATQSQTK